MKKKKLSSFDIAVYIIMIFILFITIYPLYFTVIASFSDSKAVASGDVVWKPVKFTIEAYRHVFTYKDIWRGYGNSLIYTVAGTLFNLFLTIPAAYALSKKYLPGRGFIMTLFLITMYFGGGMVPRYLLMRDMGLLNTRVTLIIMSGLSVYYLIVTRVYFSSSISNTLYEAAEIDGAGEFRRFFGIALPLSKPIIAVMTLYFAVWRWNDYYNAMIYTSDKALEPLQSVLRRVLILNQSALNEDMMQNLSAEALAAKLERANLAYTMKYAVVFIASAPLLAAYPFVQKHFVKGVMIGALKE